MSTIGRSVRRGVLPLALLLLAGPAVAEPPRGSDLIEQYKNRQAVAAQKFENEIQDAIAAAGKLAATDPAGAAADLKKALDRVTADDLLTGTRRDSLTRDLKERVRVYEANAARGPARDADK